MRPGRGTRRARIPGATRHPAQPRAVRQARNPLMDPDDTGTRATSVPHDRDTSSTPAPGGTGRARDTIHEYHLAA